MDLFKINSKVIKKAVSVIKKFEKDGEVNMVGDGSEIYIYKNGSTHYDYFQYTISDVEIYETFGIVLKISDLVLALTGASGDVIFTKKSGHSMEITSNTKKYYLSFNEVPALDKPISFKETSLSYMLAASRISDFSKTFSANLINSWCIIDDFYYLHIDKTSERVLSPNMLFYKSTNSDVEASIPGIIIKNFPQDSDAILYIGKTTCKLETNNFFIIFAKNYVNPAYTYTPSEEKGIPLNTEKLLGVVSAMDKECIEDKIDLLFVEKDNHLVFQSNTSKYVFDANIEENMRITTSCSSLKKALQFLLTDNELINLKLYKETSVKAIELSYTDGKNLEYVLLSAKR